MNGNENAPSYENKLEDEDSSYFEGFWVWLGITSNGTNQGFAHLCLLEPGYAWCCRTKQNLEKITLKTPQQFKRCTK
jgi:hypothetical protein